MAKVEYQTKEDVLLNPKGNIKGFCSNCGAEVKKSQYGTDEECPECGEWLDWEGE